MQAARTANWDSLPVQDVAEGISCLILSGSEGTLVRYTYEPGSVFPGHSHPEEQITVVHQGKIEFTIGQQHSVLEAGDTAIIPGGTSHGARVIGDQTVITDNFIASGNRAPMVLEGEKNSNASA